jgi:uncharacterized repeat protein (TIGR02543 family)
MKDANNLPLNLFSGIDMSYIKDFSYMFYHTFDNYTYATGVSENLFSSLNTSKGTSFSHMFDSTFYQMHVNESPAKLFSWLNTSNGADFSYMFYKTFYRGYVSIISSGTFSSLNTAKGTNFDSMFQETFRSVGTLTKGVLVNLFKPINTNKAVSASHMYFSTFFLSSYEGSLVTFDVADNPTHYAPTNTRPVPPPQIVEYGDKLTKPKTPTSRDYKFVGWGTCTYSYGTGAICTDFDFERNITQDIELYAQWTPLPKSVVTFNAQGGTYTSTQSVTNGLYAYQPSNPKRAGYSFTGWYNKAKGGTKFNFTKTKITKNVTIYAHWTPNPSFGPLPVINYNSYGRFIDIGKLSSDRQSAIQWMYMYAITTGSPANSNTYKPSATVNRGAMAQFMHKVVGSVKTNKKIPTVKDLSNLPKDRQTDIKWLAAEGITVIAKNGKYNPTATVNRGAMAEFMYKLAGSPGALNKTKTSKSHHVDPKTVTTQATKFKDDKALTKLKKSNPNRYYAVLWLAKNKITLGSNSSGTLYSPQKTVNRGSMAEFIMKLYRLYVK